MRFPQDSSQAAIVEATRLVAAGRPGEATTILQRSIGIAPPGLTSEHRLSSLSEGLREWLGRVAPFTRAKPAPPAHEPEHRPEAGELLARSYRNGSGTRDYRLYVPSGYRGEPVPLVIMLHGCKQSPEDFAAGTRMNQHAEELTCLAAYPEQSATANVSRCWNWFRPEDQQRGCGEPALIAGITRQVMSDFAVDSTRVYIAGLSAGGAAAAIMGSAYADLYAAVGIHSGLASRAAQDIPSAFAAMRQGGQVRPVTGGIPIVRTIVFHGDRDKTVSPQNAELILAQVAAGVELEKQVERGQVTNGHAYTRTRYVDHAGSVLLELWMIHGEGHAWSGGSREGSYTDPNGPDATREMLRFFGCHSPPDIGPDLLQRV
ncbi:MAG TPA: PHB depolymerase family esterase [Stellaceae bacterium]|nr:PHB depolymerase family esterase [Stellaceae bacterium]